MSVGLAIAVGLYGLAHGLLALVGIVYVVRCTPMPYHHDALGELRYEDLPPGARVLLDNGVGLVGAGMLATAIAQACLIVGPLTAGDVWARFAVPSAAAVIGLGTLRATRSIGDQTPAEPPQWLAWLLMALIGVGFAASWF